MRALVFLLLPIAGYGPVAEPSESSKLKARTELRPVQAKTQQLTSPVSTAYDLFQKHCPPEAQSLEEIAQIAGAENYPPLSRLEWESLVHGVLSIETQGWIIEERGHQFVLLVERGALPTTAERLTYRSGAIVYGQPVGQGGTDPFQPNRIGSLSCSIFGRGDIGSKNLQMVSEYFKAQGHFAMIIDEGVSSPVGRSRGERWQSKSAFVRHGIKTKPKDEHLFSFAYSTRSPLETILPNFKFSRGTAIFREAQIDESQNAE